MKKINILLQFCLCLIALIIFFVSFFYLHAYADKPPIPEKGVYIGAILLDGQSFPYEFNERIGYRHAFFGEFFVFPEVVNPESTEYKKLIRFLEICKSAGAMPLLTIETHQGLSSYRIEHIQSLAELLNQFQLPIFLRWNHEMNGSWYAWGQQPALYIEKFREFATIMHTMTSNVAMAWTPNQGWGYPWPNGNYSISDDNITDIQLLDTNKDNKITAADDPYMPYYPGDDYVDWVGFSFYHWGNALESGYNQIPDSQKWADANGLTGAIQNFHEIFAVGHQKPMMISETAAFFDLNDIKGGGASENDIKTEWIKQVYNLNDPNLSKLDMDLPNLKAICWFNQAKFETEFNGIVDWRLDSNLSVAQVYQNIIANTYFIKAIFDSDYAAFITSPVTVQSNTTYRVEVQYRAVDDREIEINLLDSDNFTWYGGKRIKVTKGADRIGLNVVTQSNIFSNKTYFWDLMVLPVGSDWTEAFYKRQKPVWSLQSLQTEHEIQGLTVLTQGLTVSLSWDTVPNAEGYTLLYAPYPDMNPIGEIDLGNITQLSANLDSKFACYIAVRPYSIEKTEPISDIWSFQLP
ncbi:MAG: hypothetical protein HQK77_06070 [Desulfobacterales bacterium]|nr:hypothetical protein [Desulfobacterales bacterium]